MKKLILAASVICLSAVCTLAHPSPNSAVSLDFHHDGVVADLTLPLPELELSFKQPFLSAPAEVLPKYRAALNDYVLAHVKPEADDGRAWSVAVQGMEMKLNEKPVDLVVHLWMQPPAGASVRKFKFNYSVINHEVMSHWVLVYVRNDWNTAVFSDKPEPVGSIHFLDTFLEIDRSRGNWWQGFHTVFNLGLHHIAEGTDHLLFLLVLLLPAPLLANKNRWANVRNVKNSVLQLLKIVSAFTIGHSLTLAIGAMGFVHWPEPPIEVLIAVSIFISAIHAIRPWFAGKEIFIAGGFGLIHGLVFASSLSEFNFSAWAMVSTVFSFNLGIETMQLVVVAATIPWLLLLSRTNFYSPLRIVGATFAAIASLGWIIERSFNVNLRVDSVVNIFAHHPLWQVGSLAALALLATVWKWVKTISVEDHAENRLQSTF
jgi:HupE / UreJ protein